MYLVEMVDDIIHVYNDRRGPRFFKTLLPRLIRRGECMESPQNGKDSLHPI